MCCLKAMNLTLSVLEMLKHSSPDHQVQEKNGTNKETGNVYKKTV